MATTSISEQDLDDFKAITHADHATAVFFLEASQGNMQRALNMFADHEQHQPAPASHASRVSTATRHAQQMPARRPSPHGRPATGSWIGRLVRRVFSWAGRGIQTGLDIVHVILATVLPRPWLQSITASAQAAAIAWLPHLHQHPTSLRHTYGEALPTFVETSWREALNMADSQQKMLCVYLHAPDHADTDHFCRGVLSHPDVRRFIDENFVAWAGNVTQSDAYQLSSILRVATYPHIAIIMRAGNRRGSSVPAIQLMACIEGVCEPGVLLTAMAGAVEGASSLLTQARQAQSERDSARRLREEQDAALRASMQADLEREKARRAEEAAAEAARAEKLREEEALRAAQLAQEQALQKRIDSIAERRALKASTLPPEPEASPSATLLRVRLPTGATSQRRFSAADTVSSVYDFVDSLDDLAAWDYMLSSTFPRREYPRDEGDLTLQDAGLVPNAALMVTTLDD